METLGCFQHMMMGVCLSVASIKGTEDRDPVTGLERRLATSCPPNSHYHPCTTACPASCAEPTSPDTCRLPCVKGCACDSGFLLYNGSCVSHRQCGCRHEGKHYPVGSQFWTDHTCSSRCTCPSPGGQLGCSSDSCPKGSYCGVENSTIGCYNYTHKVCRVHGDPHYSTFDNENYHFMGNCTYTLAKLCSKLAELPHFNIEAKNEYLESPSRSFVHKVLMDLYGHHIEIHKGNQHQVLVDQIWRTLPVKHGKGSVSVSRSGRYISVETDFQLIINYDADHLVEIRMPTTFANATCGLCGNFNNLKDDDNLMPNGQRAKNAAELGKSWQVPGAEYDRPYCEVPDITPPCSTYQEDAYKENEFCGILTNSEGPFQVCHSTISPESFFDTCVRDMCAFNGKQTLLCNTLGAYGDACQREGVALGNWRIDTFCLFLCPSHSEHDMCTSACPTTCANPLAPKNCSKPCVEGCKCHEGYILSGQQCVLTEDCGCLDEGKYYEKGATFWKTDCRGRCHCAENGTLTCNTETCKADQICKVQNGILACYTSDKASCHIYGDPHYVTFDGRLYHFQGGCNYTAVETYNHSSEEFSVTIRKERWGHQAWTALNAVAVSLKNLHIALRKNKEVYVNGVKVDIPTKLDHGIMVEERSPYVVASFPFGLQVEFDADRHLFIEVAEKFKQHLRGLCGIYSSNEYDEFVTPSGTVEDDPNRFGRSWMVEDAGWKCDPVVTVPPACSRMLKDRYKGLCNVISDIKGPFQACQWKINPLKYVTSCVYDQCASAGNSKHCRKSLEDYAATCLRAGVKLGVWWTDTLCEPSAQCSFPCSFDNDLCLWTQSTSDNFDWTRHKGPTPSQMTGPPHDHTTGSGYYLYVEGDHVIEGDVAHLISPTCLALEPHCFSFWYHIFGAASLMSLRVYVVPEGKEPIRLWIATGRKANQWLHANVTVPSMGKLQIIVEGMRGEDFASDLAVDDISMSNGSCTVLQSNSLQVTPSGICQRGRNGTTVKQFVHILRNHKLKVIQSHPMRGVSGHLYNRLCSDCGIQLGPNMRDFICKEVIEVSRVQMTLRMSERLEDQQQESRA